MKFVHDENLLFFKFVSSYFYAFYNHFVLCSIFKLGSVQKMLNISYLENKKFVLKLFPIALYSLRGIEWNYLQFSLIYRSVCAMDVFGKDFTPSFSNSFPATLVLLRNKNVLFSRVSFTLPGWKSRWKCKPSISVLEFRLVEIFPFSDIDDIST